MNSHEVKYVVIGGIAAGVHGVPWAVARMMTEHATIPQAPQGEIDFAKYRKPELAEKVAELVGIPGRLRTIAMCALASVVALLLAVFVLFDTPDDWPIYGSAIVYIYAAIAAVVLGVMWGCIVNVTRSVDNSIKIVDVLLELSQSVSQELVDLRDGNVKLPGRRQLIVGVYDHVFLPVLRSVVLGQSKWLGRPTYWVYRYTVGGVVRRLLRLSAGAEDRETVATVTGNLDSAQQSADRTSAWLQWARGCLERFGPKLQRVIVVPLWTVFAIACAVGVVPLVIAWYLTLPEN